MRFAFWTRVDTKLLNLSHHVLSMDGWPGDATFPLWGQPLKIMRMYSGRKRSSPLDFIFDTCASASSSHLFGWWSWTYVVVDFFKDTCIFNKKNCVLNFGRALTQNYWICPIVSYLWMVGLVMRLFPVGPTFEGHPHVFSHKRSSPLDFIFDTWASASSSHLFGWWSWTYVVVDFFNHKCMFSQKSCVLHCGRALIQNYWICPIMSYLWMVGLVMRLFSCWANLWRSCACIQAEKGPAPWILFLTPAPRPLQVTFLVGEAEHMWLQPFARTNVFSAKNMCFAFWARVQDKCTPLQGQMYLWNLFLMSNLRTFSIIIIIAPFPQI